MTKKQTIQKLISMLIDKANSIPEIGWQEYAANNNISCGVCWLASAIDINLYNDTWVNYWYKFDCNHISYWVKPFSMAKTREHLLQLFETRIFILTMELESGVQ